MGPGPLGGDIALQAIEKGWRVVRLSFVRPASSRRSTRNQPIPIKCHHQLESPINL